MGRILGHARVPLSVLASLLLIVGAYWLAQGIGSPPNVRASEETALLGALAARDTDHDGLPDWEEVLYGTDPAVADTFNLGMADGAAVAKGLIVPKAVADIPVAVSTSGSFSLDPSLPAPPADTTLTAAFSKEFLMAYLAEKQKKGGAELSQDEVNTLANDLLDSLSTSVAAAHNYRSPGDIRVAGSGADAMRAYAASAEAVLVKNTSNATTSELNYLDSVLSKGDMTALPHIASIAKAYRDSAAGLAVLPVPQEVAQAHLDTVNALMRIGEVTSDFARVNTDPLATMLALYQYPRAVVLLAGSLAEVEKAYASAGVTLAPGTPGASYVNVVSSAMKNTPEKP